MTADPTLPWFGEQPEPTRTGLGPAGVAEIIQHDLRGIPMGGMPIAVEPVIVPATSYRELLDATGRLLDLHRRAVAELAPDGAGRVAALRLDPESLPRFTAEEEFELRHCADVARADVVIGGNGPQFIELNVSAGIGGMVQFETLRRAWARIRRENGEPALLGVDPFEQLARVIRQTSAELAVDPSALLIGNPHDPSKDPRYFEVQTQLLRGHGVPARYVHLDDLPEAMGTPEEFRNVLGIIRFCEEEVRAMGWDLTPVVAAMREGFRAVPSQTNRLLDSKKVLALISEGLPWMSAEDRELARRFVPWTRVMGDRRTEWRGQRYELPRLLLERPEPFVLKGAAGYSSQEVFFGARTDPAEWEKLVTAAAESEYYVAQEIVAPVRHPVRVVFDDSGRPETVAANSVISPFCVGGTATGCLVRFDRATEPGAVTVRSGAMLACLLGAPS